MAGLVMAVQATVLANSGSSASPGASKWAGTPGGGVDVRSFGARGDGIADDTEAIQAAVSSLPVQEVAPWGKPNANGGVVLVPRGRYKVTRTITLPRGIRVVGESRESSQFLSFTPGSVFRYAGPYRYVAGEVVFENLSIWQDVSVPAKSGAAVEIGLGPGKSNAVFFRGSNLTIEGTFEGILLEAGIGCALRDVTISRTVSHGVHLKYRPDVEANATQTTSTTLQNVYSYFSQVGDGFRFEGCAYVSCVSCAADSNGGFGYVIQNAMNTTLLSSGAEQNHQGGVRLVDSQSTILAVSILQSGPSSAHAVTLERARATSLLGSWVSGLNGAGGFGINILEPAGFVTVIASRFTGTFAGIPFNRPEMVVQVGVDGAEPLVVPSMRFGKTGPLVKFGAGVPEGQVAAPVASLFGRTDGGSSATLYTKTKGDGATGWAIVGGVGGVAERGAEVIPGSACARETIVPVEGAVPGAPCSVGLPSESPPNLLATCHVAATGQIKLRLCNVGREPLATRLSKYSVRAFSL
jgi:hypothetical protein